MARLVDRAYYTVYMQHTLNTTKTSSLAHHSSNKHKKQVLVSRPRRTVYARSAKQSRMHDTPSSLLHVFLSQCQDALLAGKGNYKSINSMQQRKEASQSFVHYFGLAWENLSLQENQQRSRSAESSNPDQMSESPINSPASHLCSSNSQRQTIAPARCKLSKRQRRRSVHHRSIDSSLSCLETIARRHGDLEQQKRSSMQTQTLYSPQSFVHNGGTSLVGHYKPSVCAINRHKRKQLVEPDSPLQEVHSHRRKRRRYGTSVSSTSTHHSTLNSALVTPISTPFPLKNNSTPLQSSLPSATSTTAIVSDSEEGQSPQTVTESPTTNRAVSDDEDLSSIEQPQNRRSPRQQQKHEACDFWPAFLAALQLEVSSRTMRCWNDKVVYKVYQLAGATMDVTRMPMDKLGALIHDEFQTSFANKSVSCYTNVRYRADTGTMWIQFVLPDPSLAVTRSRKHKPPTTILAIIKPESFFVALGTVRSHSSSGLLPCVLYTLSKVLLSSSSNVQGKTIFGVLLLVHIHAYSHNALTLYSGFDCDRFCVCHYQKSTPAAMKI
jgi:hypothetical protein